MCDMAAAMGWEREKEPEEKAEEEERFLPEIPEGIKNFWQASRSSRGGQYSERQV